MEYTVHGHAVGYGDDVLQMLDIAEATSIGRHRQTEAILRREDEVDRQLVVDECVVVLDSADVADPVRGVAVAILKALDVDPDGPIRRLDAGTPTLERLKRADHRRERMEVAKEAAADAGSTAIDAAKKGLSFAADVAKEGLSRVRGRLLHRRDP